MRTLIHALMLATVLTACSSATEDQTNNQKAVVDAVQQPLEKPKTSNDSFWITPKRGENRWTICRGREIREF